MKLLIFGCVASLFFYLAWRTNHSKTPVNLWANDPTEIKVTDVIAYNRACAKLLFFYGCMLLVAGLLLIFNHIMITILTILLIVFSSFGLIAIYTFIEGEYRL